MKHLCVGCGLCATICPHNQIKMLFSNTYGFYRPSFSFQECEIKCGLCEKCCPFVPDNPPTTDVTTKVFEDVEGILNNDILGYYIDTYEGYSQTHRKTSSSGGLSTWLLETLLQNGEIDGAICVGASPNSPTLFDFRACHTTDEIRNCAGSCYQPVELSGLLDVIRKHPNKQYAIVALPCYAKGLRLAMRNHPKLNSQIRFILGLVCGQMKSKNFVDYLCSKYAGRTNPSSAFFRCKRPGEPAKNYTYKFTWPDNFSVMPGWVEAVSHPWKERWFTLESCDYCDDIFAECADATFMDAWLPEYSSESGGRNLIITRNPILNKLFQNTPDNIHITSIATKKIINSQEGVIHQKRMLSVLHKKNHTQNLQLPNIRRNDKPHFSDTLEAWTKRRIRKMTQSGITESITELDARILKIKQPQDILRKPLRFINRLRKLGNILLRR